ncbi:MAG TPA: hypothetical protein VE967_04130, partial [Gemmatimonadaceae bacterium]|nr:hypothetical protein [Gemmatimonadaceae bacterium]
YEPPFANVHKRRVAFAGKLVLILLILILPFNDSWAGWNARARTPKPVPFVPGVYEVTRYVVGKDTVPFTANDTTRWRDVIFDAQGQGSVGSTDSLFWQRYRRGYFRYRADTAKHLTTVWRTSWLRDSVFLFTARYEMPDTNHIRMWTRFHNDSLFVELVRTPRHFQLSERQFHWLSEYNR